MNDDLKHRQEIERNYHNNKYKDNINNAVKSSDSDGHAYNTFYHLIEQLKPGRILDFGCGDGWISMKLAEKGHEVHGIDISIELVTKARKWSQKLGLSQKVHFEEMAGENLLFDDNFFDAVIGSAVLHHIDLELALNSIHRVLKPGRKGLFIEPMNQNIILKIWRVLTPWRRSPAERALTLLEIKLIKQRFPAARLNYFILFSMFSQGLMTLFPKQNLWLRINRQLEVLDDILITRFPFLGKFCAVVVIELIKD